MEECQFEMRQDVVCKINRLCSVQSAEILRLECIKNSKKEKKEKKSNTLLSAPRHQYSGCDMTKLF